MIDIPDTIFPKDEQGNLICPKCNLPTDKCTCPGYDPQTVDPQKYSLKIRVEKSGRKGKTVTLINGLPEDESYLSELAKELKNKTASGGTFYLKDGSGVIEIQGDKKSVVQSILHEKGFSLN